MDIVGIYFTVEKQFSILVFGHYKIRLYGYEKTKQLEKPTKLLQDFYIQLHRHFLLCFPFP